MSLRDGLKSALESLGVKDQVKRGVNKLRELGDLPPLGEPAVYRDLERLAATPRPRPAATRGKLLVFTMRGWTTHVALETLLGEAAAQRGMTPVFYTCGGPLPLCGITTFRAPDPTPCEDCYGYVSRYHDALGFEHLRLENLVPAGDRQELERLLAGAPDRDLETMEFDQLPLGRLVRTSVNWFLLRGTLDRSESGLQVMRAFTLSGMIVARAADRLLDQAKPDRIFCLNGLFFAERILRHVARRKGIPVTTYERGFRPSTWVFRHDEIACEYRIGPDFRSLGDRPLTSEEESRLSRYLDDRSQGLSDVRQYWPGMEESRRKVVEQLGLDPGLPIVSVFTNITWDTAVQERDIAFEGMFDWLETTVETLGEPGGAQLVIRIHPAEIRLRRQETAESVRDLLASRLGSRMDHVRIVPAESPLSSYTLAALSKYVIVYTSTVGLEFACAGRTVVVAGDTHYRGLGFTRDPSTKDEYVALLKSLAAGQTDPVDVEKARRYASFFFFNFMVPLRMTTEEKRSEVRIALESLDELQEGRDPVLDTVMRGLMEGTPIFCDPDKAYA